MVIVALYSHQKVLQPLQASKSVRLFKVPCLVPLLQKFLEKKLNYVLYAEIMPFVCTMEFARARDVKDFSRLVTNMLHQHFKFTTKVKISTAYSAERGQVFMFGGQKVLGGQKKAKQMSVLSLSEMPGSRHAERG